MRDDKEGKRSLAAVKPPAKRGGSQRPQYLSGEELLSPPVDESYIEVLRELVAHLRQKRTELREEWARRIMQARLLKAMTEDEILAELGAAETDLAIMSSHGRSGFERHVLGSVAAAEAQSSTSSDLELPSDFAVLAAADLTMAAHSSA